ncbi:DUF6438 domain-containing protein [Gemmatimonas aurantiaca]|uniref:DUF6438 domain-containing protein n=1 Tax=Gemmatimonas aurantiaca TaxID=173480 RepID=UPI00301D3AF0
MNMRSRIALFALLVIGSVTGSACRTPAAERNPGDSTTMPAGTQSGTSSADGPATASMPAALLLERGPCYGRCPVYSVALFTDGSVYFDGRDHVGSSGIHKSAVASSDVAALLARFRQGFFALKDTLYTQDTPGCGNFVTDGPSINIALQDGTRSRRVRLDGGCTGAPALIRQFGAAIDSVARTSSWIVGNGGTD